MVTADSPDDTTTAKGSPARSGRRDIFPRSVLGIVSVLVAFSVGASLSGVAFFSYYDYRATNYEKRIDNYINNFDQRFRTATETIDNQQQNAQAAVQKELDPLRQFQAEGGTLASLVQKVGPSIFLIETLDDKGAPSVGSGFVVESNDKEAIVVTSYSTVKAATVTPGPDIFATKGGDKTKARLDNWVEDRDLAVLTVPKGNIPKLAFVAQDQQPRVGERTFAASGLGAAGASITQGFVSDVSQGSVQHDSPIGQSFQGGPLINSNGDVTAIASLNYAPFGFGSGGGVGFAIPIRTACEKLLRCPAGNNSVTGVNPR